MGVPLPNEPTRDELRIRVQRRPGPDAPKAEFVLEGGRKVLVLGMAEGPNLIALDALAPASPTSQRIRITVFLAIPVIRQVARMEFPSTRADTTRTRLSTVSVFMGLLYMTGQAL